MDKPGLFPEQQTKNQEYRSRENTSGVSKQAEERVLVFFNYHFFRLRGRARQHLSFVPNPVLILLCRIRFFGKSKEEPPSELKVVPLRIHIFRGRFRSPDKP